MSALLRRLVTVPSVLTMTALVLAMLPAWLPLAWLASFLPGLAGIARTGLFVTAYLVCESAGIAVSAWLRIRHGAPVPDTPAHARWLDANFRLQCWWADRLRAAAERIFRLHFVIEGTDALDGPGAIVLPRHASIGDTVLPVVFYCLPRRIRLRYVLKKELRYDPCLDIVGDRLPNRFVDRDGDDRDEETRGIARLLDGIGPHEGVLIYPEGTRFSIAKRARALDSLRARGRAELAQRAEAWTDLLPPRPAGTVALLTANPGLDVVLMAHIGFEGSAGFRTLVNGSWTGSTVRVYFWRVAYADIPRDADGARAFLLDQWDRMQAEISRLTGMPAA